MVEVVKIGLHADVMESNKIGLFRANLSLVQLTTSVTEMVIVETDLWALDRSSNAFAILQHSATINGMLLEWKYSYVKNSTEKNYQNEIKSFPKTK